MSNMFSMLQMLFVTLAAFVVMVERPNEGAQKKAEVIEAVMTNLKGQVSPMWESVIRMALPIAIDLMVGWMKRSGALDKINDFLAHSGLK